MRLRHDFLPRPHGLGRGDLLALVGLDAGEDVVHGVRRCETSTSFWSVALARPLSISARRQLRAELQRVGPAGDDEPGGGIEQHDVAVGARRAVEQFAQAAGIVLRIAALEVGQRCRAAGRRPRALTSKLVRLPPLICATRLGPVVESSSRPSWPWTTQAETARLARRAAAIGSTHSRAIDAEHVAPRAGRVRLRAEKVEHRADAELGARRADMLHRRVMGRREHEADAGLGDACGRSARA